MKFFFPKVLNTKVNFDKRGYLIETFKRKKINSDFKYSILVSSKKMFLEVFTFRKKNSKKNY